VTTHANDDATPAAVRRLRAARPRSRFVTASLALLAALAGVSWATGGYSAADVLSERRLRNLARFASEIVPHTWSETRDWQATAASVADLLQTRGLPATWNTLLFSVAGICLAGALALLVLPFASATLARPRPFEPGSTWPWRIAFYASRATLVTARSVPEYILAFLFLAVLGPTAWPVVLALGLHNAGILGRLGSEVVENFEPDLPRSMAAAGHSRWQLFAASLAPASLPRFLVYFFYRWETCVRDATVLGMLGFTSLGYFIRDARSRQLHDEMLVFVLLGAAMVVAGDFFSGWVRRRVRGAGG
jgi:phosphonate transport system permease protein